MRGKPGRVMRWQAAPRGEMVVMRIQVASTWLTRARGLLGSRDRVAAGKTLLIVPCRSIHTFGMREHIDVAFVDAQGLVRRSYINLAPNRLLVCRDARMVLERFTPKALREVEGEIPRGALPVTCDDWPHAGDTLQLQVAGSLADTGRELAQCGSSSLRMSSQGLSRGVVLERQGGVAAFTGEVRS